MITASMCGFYVDVIRAGRRSDSFRLADHPFTSWGVQVPDALPWERVQQITRAVQNQVVLSQK